MTFNVVVRDETGAVAFDLDSKTILGVQSYLVPPGQSSWVPKSADEGFVFLSHFPTLESMDSGVFVQPDVIDGSDGASYLGSTLPFIVVKVRKS